MFSKNLHPTHRELLGKALAKAKDVLRLLAEGHPPKRQPWAPGRKQVTVKEAGGWVQYWTDEWRPALYTCDWTST